MKSRTPLPTPTSRPPTALTRPSLLPFLAAAQTLPTTMPVDPATMANHPEVQCNNTRLNRNRQCLPPSSRLRVNRRRLSGLAASATTSSTRTKRQPSSSNSRSRRSSRRSNTPAPKRRISRKTAFRCQTSSPAAVPRLLVVARASVSSAPVTCRAPTFSSA